MKPKSKVPRFPLDIRHSRLLPVVISPFLLTNAFAANVTLNTSNAAGASSFASATSCSNAAAPSAGNDYFVTTARTLRTVADSGSATFAGGSLTLGDNTTAGILILKNQASGAVVTINSLTLNNGEIQAGATSTGAVNTIAIGGSGITLANSTAANRLMCVDPANPNIIYISSNAANPFDLSDVDDVPLKANARFEIYRGVTSDGGLSFSWTPVTSNSAADNLRPIIPENSPFDQTLLWFNGTYNSYTGFDTRVLAILRNDLRIRTSSFSPAPDSGTLEWEFLAGMALPDHRFHGPQRFSPHPHHRRRIPRRYHHPDVDLSRPADEQAQDLFPAGNQVTARDNAGCNRSFRLLAHSPDHHNGPLPWWFVAFKTRS
jgi:hypothetical protein